MTKGRIDFKGRTKERPVRTISQITMQMKIPCYQSLPIYQVLSLKIKELKIYSLEIMPLTSPTIRKSFTAKKGAYDGFKETRIIA